MVQNIKNIGYLVNFFGPAGLENFVLSLANRIDRQRFQPHIFVVYYSDPEFVKKLSPDVKVVHLHREPGNTGAFLKRLMSTVRKHNIHILQVHNWGTFLEGAFVKIMNPQVKLVHVQQGLEYENTLKASQWKRRIRKVLRYVFIRLFSQVVACSIDARFYLMKEWGAKRIKVIYNSVDIEKFKPNGLNRYANLDKPNSDFRVCTMGRIVAVKNFLCLFKAINLLKDRIPNLKLYHIGARPIVGESVQTELLNFVKENKLDKFVHFWGLVDDVPEKLNSCDIFALTSFSEGLSFSLVEAQACGLPAIVTNVGGNPEVIQDGVNGFLVPSNDEKAVAEAIYKLYCDKELRKKMSQNAIEIIRSKFNQNKMVKAYEAIYQSV